MSKKNRITPQAFEAVLAEFIEDNPLACQGILSVARVEFTEEIPTLAVTLRDDPPLLLVNPAFLNRHVRTEEDIRALLLHEFLHVLLGHTRLFDRMDDRTNLALDAVINHIVQRELGHDHAAFFRRFYKPKGDHDPVWLLRPHAPGDIPPQSERCAIMADCDRWRADGPTGRGKAIQIHWLRRGLALGKVLADDVLDLIDALDLEFPQKIEYLGGHKPGGESQEEDTDAAVGEGDTIHPANLERLEQAFTKIDPNSIISDPAGSGIGFGATAIENAWKAGDPNRQWRAITMPVLRRLLVESANAGSIEQADAGLLPVATSQDRRAALRALWNPILPEFNWNLARPTAPRKTNVYLDVSASMGPEINLLTGLLVQLRHWVRTPFHAFSNGIQEARIVDGRLQTLTTGGTCFNDVLRHILESGTHKSLIMTDGFIEQPDKRLLDKLSARRQQIHVLIASHGTSQRLDAHDIPCTKLPKPDGESAKRRSGEAVSTGRWRT